MMGKQAANGPFTPAVVAVRAVVGEKQFNQLRGKVQQPPTLPMVAAVPCGRTGRVLDQRRQRKMFCVISVELGSWAVGCGACHLVRRDGEPERPAVCILLPLQTNTRVPGSFPECRCKFWRCPPWGCCSREFMM